MKPLAYVRRSSACVHRHGPAHATRVPKTMIDKFSVLMLRFGTNPTSFGSYSKPSFSHYIKPYMVPFQDTQKILRENLISSESKREFFTKHP